MADEAPTKEKKKPEGLVIPPKKPKLSKAERRALQEQQRAAKAAKQQPKGGQQQQQQQAQGGKGGAAQQANQQQQNQPEKGSKQGASKDVASKEKETSTAKEKTKENPKTISLFSHLPPYQDPKSVVDSGPRLWPKALSPTANSPSTGAYPLHPAVIALGYQYARGEIRGGNSRCRAMLRVFHQVIGDFQPPPNPSLSELRQQVDQWILKPSFQYWTSFCRPHSVTMGNAFTFLKTAVASLERDVKLEELVENVQDNIEAYIRERIDLAQQAIAQQLELKPNDEPQVFLTYGNSEAIAATFLRMADESDVSHFRVIIVDSRPLLEGKDLLLKLRAANIDCSYILMSALTYVMRDVTKVYLGAAALMSDGGLLGRVGTACVALSAHMHHIPVLACCESYKISNRVQLESITGNELGDPNQVAVTGSPADYDDIEPDSVLKDWLETDNLRLLNLLYDLTPSEFVSGIVTELGIIPPTSVAVLLREMNAQN